MAVAWRRQSNSVAAFSGMERGLGGHGERRKMKKLEFVAVLQLDTKTKGRGFLELHCLEKAAAKTNPCHRC